MVTALAIGLAGAAALVTFLAGVTALAAGFPLGLPAAGSLVGAAVALLLFPGLAFTSCLLAELFCAWSVVPAAPPRLLEVLSGGASPARECTGFPIGKPISCKIETIIWLSIRKKLCTVPGYAIRQCRTLTPAYTNDCSIPCKRMSLGKSMPMNTILLPRASPSAHCGPRSLPINWCTPWKMTFRSVPFIYRTPL